MFIFYSIYIISNLILFILELFNYNGQFVVFSRLIHYLSFACINLVLLTVIKRYILC